MRIIIDGTVGCGKTSVIWVNRRETLNIRGFRVGRSWVSRFTDLVINVIKHMRNSGINDPSQNWDIFSR